ncbi:LEAF RUST 10 DISEASE-RESISTANCE LOCUS RECEPTOR-LIKE PROTEIN KINASE-like 1.3 [Gastrolobium bilobum]|uniref:LEAF RUST 10 DISEASE-RESISTANCE LOCUS RECEPTOR-LIKE PROTEIN KINASE-like 1.3 n=1 Tax=Gastrolobium bilobum TaxID=150636 RepID=UPI002AB14700|nr:LEAF RUST 10 DISEASE-RESISTANCE LOCUS RECEPTOR-LIKE PROTEIN KINASE-like 1.3 [Gastrolobium bilobum]
MYNCGKLRNISFPFWGEDRPNECGHPLLHLNCTNDQTYISINDIKYKVLDANQDNQTLRIARVDYLQDLCPLKFLNTTLDPELFVYGPNYTNITFFYGCHESNPFLNFSPGRFPCTMNIGSINVYVYTQFEALGPSMLCNTSVVVPVQVTLSLLDIGNVTKIQGALTDGFEVRWIAGVVECEDCKKSGGVCGYDLNSNQATCYCKSSDSGSITCPSPVQGKKSKVVAVGIASGIVAGILLGCWVYLQRKKRIVEQSKSKDLFILPSSNGTVNSTTNVSSSISSYPSSKSDSVQKSLYFGVHVFSYAELEQGTKKFDPSRELGDGGFGTVYYGNLKDGREVAVKRLYERNLKRVSQFMNEVEILARLRHKNLVALYGCTSRQSQELLLVYEYIPNGTVADHLHGKRTKSMLLPWQVRLNIAIETAEALSYLHASDVIHRDVKTNNILLDDKFSVKVADFGLSRLFPNDVTHVSTAPQGTPGYVDPEYYQSYQLTDKSDVYSFGVVLVELVSSLPAVDITRHRHDVNLANMAISKIVSQSLQELVDPYLGFERDYAIRQMITAVAGLAFRCLQEIDMRPSMEEVLEVLRGIQYEGYDAHKIKQVVDIIRADEVTLLQKTHYPFSLDSVSDKWGSL